MSHSVTLLMGADNLAPHCSEANLRESRERYESIKLVWAFTAGGCTDAIAGPDNNLVQKEKLLVRQKYRADIRKRSHAWRKTAADGGLPKPSVGFITLNGFRRLVKSSLKTRMAIFGTDTRR